MPRTYRRRTYRPRKAFRGRRRRYTGWKSVRLGTMARYAYKGVKYLRSLVNSEKHKYDTSISQVVTTAPAFVQINDLAIGDTDSTRTGNSVLMKDMSYRGIFYINPANTVSWLRMVILMDTQQIGDTTPAFNDIFEANTVNSQLNSNTVGRYTILKDKVYVLSDQKPGMSIKGVIPLKTHARFNGTSNADIQKNGIYAYFVSADATNGPTINMNFRLNYYDN